MVLSELRLDLAELLYFLRGREVAGTLGSVIVLPVSALSTIHLVVLSSLHPFPLFSDPYLSRLKVFGVPAPALLSRTPGPLCQPGVCASPLRAVRFPSC